jgi:hypothetical protein
MASQDIRVTRSHRILSARLPVLTRNIQCWKGGAPYINAALLRGVSEDDTSWKGDTARGIVGRKDRAYLIDYASRIVGKINQYIFSQDILREGADPAFLANVTKTGMAIDRIMEEVSGALTVGQWAWVQVDRGALAIDPATQQPTPRTVAQREAAGDSIYWSLWRSNEVVDWCFAPDGSLLWLMTEHSSYDNIDPNIAPVEGRIRTLWKRGEGIRLHLDAKGEVTREEPFGLSAPIVPFALVGIPTSEPWWFDDVEKLQAALLNLESANFENLIGACYPQLIVPTGLLENVMTMSGLQNTPQGLQQAIEIVRGLNYPIAEAKESAGQTRYLVPPSADLEAIPRDITRLRTEMYDVAGMAMKNQGAQVESAEAKAWNHLDVEAAIAVRSNELQVLEAKCVKHSKLLDTTFAEYAPQYPTKFDVSDFAADVAAIMQLGNVLTGAEAEKELQRAAVKAMSRQFGTTPDREAVILKEIEETTAIATAPTPLT